MFLPLFHTISIERFIVALLNSIVKSVKDGVSRSNIDCRKTVSVVDCEEGGSREEESREGESGEGESGEEDANDEEVLITLMEVVAILWEGMLAKSNGKTTGPEQMRVEVGNLISQLAEDFKVRRGKVISALY